MWLIFSSKLGYGFTYNIVPVYLVHKQLFLQCLFITALTFVTLSSASVCKIYVKIECGRGKGMPVTISLWRHIVPGNVCLYTCMYQFQYISLYDRVSQFCPPKNSSSPRTSGSQWRRICYAASCADHRVCTWYLSCQWRLERYNPNCPYPVRQGRTNIVSFLVVRYLGREAESSLTNIFIKAWQGVDLFFMSCCFWKGARDLPGKAIGPPWDSTLGWTS